MAEPALDALRRALPGVPVLAAPADTAPDLRDWSGDATGAALAVLRPGTTDEVAAVVRACGALGLGVVPQGGNTGLVEGGLPTDAGRHVLLSLDRMRRVRAIDPDGMTVTADAGCILQAVKEAVEAYGLLLPLSMGSQGSATLGGAVSTNAGGSNVLRWGMTRAQMLGLEVVLAAGRVWDGLGALRKDNRGPDLKQLFIGAEGAFGVVTGVTMALVPRPTRAETALLGLGSLEDAVALLRRARVECADLLSAFEFMGPEAVGLAWLARPDLPVPMAEAHPVLVLLELSCAARIDLAALLSDLLEAAMADGLVRDGAVAASAAQAADLWGLREGLAEGQARRGRHLRTDASLSVPAVAGFVDATRARLAAELPGAEPVAYGHLGDVNVHFTVLPRPPTPCPPTPCPDRLLADARAVILDEVARRGGSFSAEHGIGRAKREDLARTQGPEARRMLLAVKRALDPRGAMNPGCLVATPGPAVALPPASAP